MKNSFSLPLMVLTVVLTSGSLHAVSVGRLCKGVMSLGIGFSSSYATGDVQKTRDRVLTCAAMAVPSEVLSRMLFKKSVLLSIPMTLVWGMGADYANQYRETGAIKEIFPFKGVAERIDKKYKNIPEYKKLKSLFH